MSNGAFTTSSCKVKLAWLISVPGPLTVTALLPPNAQVGPPLASVRSLANESVGVPVRLIVPVPVSPVPLPTTIVPLLISSVTPAATSNVPVVDVNVCPAFTIRSASPAEIVPWLSMLPVIRLSTPATV